MMFPFRVWLEEKLGLSMFWWKFVCWICFAIGSAMLLVCLSVVFYLIRLPGVSEIFTQHPLLIVAWAACFWVGFLLADGGYLEAAHGF